MAKGFTDVLHNMTEYATIRASVESRRLPIGVLGVSQVSKAHIITALCEDLSRKALVITPDELQALRLRKDIEGLGGRALHFPSRDYAFRASEAVSREYEHIRITTLVKMLEGEYDAVVCSVQAARQLTIPANLLQERCFGIVSGEEFSPEAIIARLVKAGYSRSHQVDGCGQFSLRGGVLDLFAPGSEYPCRLEFWGDTVDSIHFFDIETQRRTEKIKEMKITPANEVIPESGEALGNSISELAKALRGKGSQKAKIALAEDAEKLESGVRLFSFDKYMPLIYGSSATVFDYAKNAMLFVSESFNVKDIFQKDEYLTNEALKGYLEEGVLCKGLDKYYLKWSDILNVYEKRGAVYADNLPRGSFDTPVKELVSIAARQISPWNGAVNVLAEDIGAALSRKGSACVVFAGTAKAASSLSGDLEERGLKSIYLTGVPEKFPEGSVTVLAGGLSAGLEYPQSRFTLITYGGKTDSQRVKKHRKNHPSAIEAFHSLDELHKGDYVVHVAHGIGIFDGINKLEASGTTKDYIKIKYDKSDVLYVPVTQLDQVSKYIGPRNEDRPMKLNRLGGKEWQKTRSKVRSAVKDMAKELIELYSKRMQVEGFAFSPDIDMQSDFERRFEFDETSDQLRCADEVKGDMEKSYPMDRLLCGDVGFGKTEVALRAAFKCIADGKQCALLVPTTILALQHFQTMRRRFEGFPLETRMLSRFCSRVEIAQTLKELKRGSVDMVVGTHRLISKDVEFRDLGLIIVDEEQRFGVAQKEKLKELFPAVDVLTLTATPIPRTLNMAMSGIRDMSVLEEAPQDRLPVQTFVIEHNRGVVEHAMREELRRGGQVYYLHNRVEDIESIASQIKEDIPEASVAVGHGKMSEDELSDVWRRLLECEIDILVCTTIIETGVDVPNVNTLIIDNADKMGLAQLHQIRGRVGRSSRRASAYLTFTRGRQLSEISTRRLEAIREFTEFGSGFKIAMRDLELRGAGNILGAQQHGHMEAVGYEMYLKLLEQAVSEEKGEKPAQPERECLIDLPIDAHIPAGYIESVPQRLGIYRRIADIRSAEDASDVIDELIDRFGTPPESVMGLITIAKVRGDALIHGVYEIGRKGNALLLYISELEMDKISILAKSMPGRITVSAAGKPHISVKLIQNDKQLEILTRVFKYMGMIAGK